MNFIEAIRQVHSGHKLQLPEWGCGTYICQDVLDDIVVMLVNQNSRSEYMVTPRDVMRKDWEFVGYRKEISEEQAIQLVMDVMVALNKEPIESGRVENFSLLRKTARDAWYKLGSPSSHRI